MSVSRPVRCFLLPMPKARSVPQCRNLHTSPNLHSRRRPRFASIKATDMGLVSQSTEKAFTRYQPADRAALEAKYTPDQLRVIQAGEEAINLEDVRKQGRVRNDPGGLTYLDDFSVIRPVIDSRLKRPNTVPKHAPTPTEEEGRRPWLNWIAKIRQEYENSEEYQEWQTKVQNGDRYAARDGPPNERPNRFDLDKFLNEWTGEGDPGTTALVPGLPKVPEFEGQYKKAVEATHRDPDGKYIRLIKQTGLTLDEIFTIQVRALVRHRVVNQTRLGKISSQYVLSVAGNGNGMLGIGEGKADEPDDALFKAKSAAIRNMRPIPRYEDRTIFGDVEGKVAATEVRLMTRPPGFGLRCQHNIFEMARCAGIHDLAAKVPRSRNKMNTIKAAYQALMSQRIPDEIARGRGKKLVDVRKVYYGGDQFVPKPRDPAITKLYEDQNEELKTSKIRDLQQFRAQTKRVKA